MSSQLRTDVEKLSSPGSRKVGSAGHAQAIEYLVERMTAAALEPYLETFKLPYQVESSHYTNLAGVLPGLDPALKPILLMAHYDTCGDQPGADDNAAAIAIWFEVMRLLKKTRLKRDLIFLFPDAEEPPHFLSRHMGSSNFYEKQLKHPIHAGLVLDLVGHDVPLDGMEDLIFIFGAESRPEMADVITEVDPPAGLKNIATLNRYVGDLSDHHILRENGEPYLFFTCGRWEHYHQESDVPEHLNYDKMSLISQYLVLMIESLDSRMIEGMQADFDPVDTELFLLKRALGPYLSLHNITMNNREDVQDFVLNWIKQHQL
jgi:hypothetical protein